MKKIALLLAPLALVALFSTGCTKLKACGDTNDEKVCLNKDEFENKKECVWVKGAKDGEGTCKDK